MAARMKLILMRHADAVDEGPLIDDGARYLSPRGRTQALDVGEQLGAALPDVVWASPFARALQTAELVLRGAGEARLVQVMPPLATSSAVRFVERHVRDNQEDAMFVGHEPTISAIATLLSQGEQRGGFDRAQAVVIEDGRVVRVVRARV